MHIGRCILALCLISPALHSAEIHPLKGDPVKGEIVSVSDKEVVFTAEGKQQTRPIHEVLKIELRDVGRLPAGVPYSLVELTDGTQLLASSVLLRKKEFELKLLAGPTVKLPTSLVTGVLMDASQEAHRRDWKTRTFNMRGKEAIVIKRKESGTISSIESVLGEGDESGTSLQFAVTLEGTTTEATRKLASLHGLLFKNTLGPKALKVSCKLLDTLQDVVMVSSITSRMGGLTVTTPAGATIDFQNEQIARIDYTKGKLDYLSDLEPIKLIAKSNLDEDDKPDQWHVYKDSNLDKRPLTLGGTNFGKGLALKPHVELTYDLRGEYREFEALVGIDDSVSAGGGVVLVVEADGKELTNLTITPEDKQRSRTVTLNLKDVQKLRIIVKSDSEFDIARHLDLADAKVRKE